MKVLINKETKIAICKIDQYYEVTNFGIMVDDTLYRNLSEDEHEVVNVIGEWYGNNISKVNDSNQLIVYDQERADAIIEKRNLIELEQKKSEAIDWRNSELGRTDILMAASDYPYTEEMKEYRQRLRDWPDSEDFPEIFPNFDSIVEELKQSANTA